MKTLMAYLLMMFADRAYLRRTCGVAYYGRFKVLADDKLRAMIPKIPNLGGSVASMSYAFITAYVPFLYAFK
jgi:hypothetical protein